MFFSEMVSTQPCPCGFYNHPEKECVCAEGVRKRYLNKISGPLLDRIDLHVEVTPVSYDELAATKRPTISSEAIAQKVIEARTIQSKRFTEKPGLFANAQMSGRMVREVCALDNTGRELLKKA